MQTPVEMRIGPNGPGPWTESEMVSCRKALKKNARSMLGGKLRLRVGSSDLVQETLMVTVMHLSAVIGRPRRAVFQWMISVMRHRVLKHARAEKIRQREMGRVATNDAAELTDMDGDLINAELKELVLNKLGEMDDDSRRMFELRYFEGFELEQIAAEMGRTKAAVRGNLYRTLEKIRDQLKDSMS